MSELRLQLPPATPEVKLLVFAALLLAEEAAGAWHRQGRRNGTCHGDRQCRRWRPRSKN